MDAKTIQTILHEYRIFNADVLFREDSTVRAILVWVLFAPEEAELLLAPNEELLGMLLTGCA